jgi:hypothetical protein
MKNIILALTLISFLSSCEDVIDLEVQDGVQQLVVDGWLTNKAEDQTIRLSLSQAYFDNSAVRTVNDAEVIIYELDQTPHLFVNKGNGEYVLAKEDSRFLTEGRQYSLYINFNGEEYSSLSALNRVPNIDSIAYEYFKFPIAQADSTEPEDGYIAEFYARDPEGAGDTYWIRTTKNGKLLNNPTTISTAFDAGFSPGALSDGLLFILPIRQSINDGLFQHGDSLRVELWSITNDAFYYLSQVRQESGNGGIFATPPANIPTNISNLNSTSNKTALGYFGISSISEYTTVIDSTKAREPLF